MAKTYYLWTMGCQMNAADSQRLAAELEALGYTPVAEAEAASVAIVNTCVVKQQAEDRIYGRLGSLKTLKERNPALTLAVMGCLVGRREAPRLRQRFPFVDHFLPPSDPADLIADLRGRQLDEAARASAEHLRRQQDAWRDRGSFRLPQADRQAVSAQVPIVLGCSHCCTFCVIPYRRGPEVSRPRAEVLAEVRGLVAQGIREVTLLGQIVDRYGLELPEPCDLADLLADLHEIPGLQRLRFLTGHPNWCTDKLLETMARLPKVCPVLELPVQAGNDEVLANMRRGYTVAQFRERVDRARELIPDLAVHTDVIVGFCGETEAQFDDTRRLCEEVRFDKVHLSKYSPRPRTLADRNFADDVPEAEKERRRQVIDTVQSLVLAAKQSQLAGEVVEVLVDARDRGRWRGRTPQNKLVYFPDERDLRGEIVAVLVEWTGPYSLVGRAVDRIPATT